MFSLYIIYCCITITTQKWQLKTTVSIYFTQFLWLRKSRVLGGFGSSYVRILSGNSKGQYNWWFPQLISILFYFLKKYFISHIQQSSEGSTVGGGSVSQPAHSPTDKLLLLLGRGLAPFPVHSFMQLLECFHGMWLTSSWVIPDMEAPCLFIIYPQMPHTTIPTLSYW